MTQYIIAAIVLAVIGGGLALFIYGRRSGRESQQNRDLKKVEEVQDEQAKIAAQPRDRDTTVKRMRDGTF